MPWTQPGRPDPATCAHHWHPDTRGWFCGAGCGTRRSRHGPDPTDTGVCTCPPPPAPDTIAGWLNSARTYYRKARP